jgi:hypothetical protein
VRVERGHVLAQGPRVDEVQSTVVTTQVRPQQRRGPVLRDAVQHDLDALGAKGLAAQRFPSLQELGELVGAAVAVPPERAGDARGQQAVRVRGDDAVHRSHRSALVRKDPEHYRPRFPDVPPDLPYVWPASDRPRRTG